MRRFAIQVETDRLPERINGKEDFSKVNIIKVYVGVLDNFGNVMKNKEGKPMLNTYYCYPDALQKLPVNKQEEILKAVEPYNNGITLNDLQTKAKYGDFKNICEPLNKMLKGADEIVYWSSFARNVLVDKGITALNQEERNLRNLSFEVKNVFYDVDKPDRILQRKDFINVFNEGDKKLNNFEETCVSIKAIETYKAKVLDRVKALFYKVGINEKVKGKDFSQRVVYSEDKSLKLNLNFGSNDVQFFIENVKTNVKSPVSLKDFMNQQKYEGGSWHKVEYQKIFPKLYDNLGKLLKQELLIVEGNKFSVVVEFKDKDGKDVKAPLYKFFDYNVKNITEAYNFYSKVDFNKDKVNGKDNVDNFTNLCKEAYSVKVGIYSQKDGYSLITEQKNDKYEDGGSEKKSEVPIFTDFDDFKIE